MIVRLFKPRFAPLVEAGTKTTTVRPVPKRRPRAGQPISLRTWEGLPYRSPQRILRESTITEVSDFQIDRLGFFIVNGVMVDQEETARTDGFESADAMLNWFVAHYDLPFQGILIRWDVRGHPES